MELEYRVINQFSSRNTGNCSLVSLLEALLTSTPTGLKGSRVEVRPVDKEFLGTPYGMPKDSVFQYVRNGKFYKNSHGYLMHDSKTFFLLEGRLFVEEEAIDYLVANGFNVEEAREYLDEIRG